VSLENRHIETRGLEIQFVDIASSDSPIMRAPIGREESQLLTHVRIRGIARQRVVTTEFTKSRIPISRFDRGNQ